MCLRTFSLSRVSLSDCSLAVCSRSWALGVTAGPLQHAREGSTNVFSLICGFYQASSRERTRPLSYEASNQSQRSTVQGPRTWRFPSDVHHLHVGTHLQQCPQQLVCLTVEGAGEHFGTSPVSGGKFGNVERRQSGELSVHLLRLLQVDRSVRNVPRPLSFTCRFCVLPKDTSQESKHIFFYLSTFSLLFSFFRCLMQSL